ncbi:MAG: hypothetical protein ACYTGB_03385 [Planctomycetota bacterium]|jgi:prepilin-type processing-associated H-X9-DG protein
MSLELARLPEPRSARDEGATFARRWSRGLRWVILAVGLSGLSVLVLAAFVQSRRETCARSPCKSNLRQIGLACLMYAEDNGGSFPPDFASLVPEYIDGARVLSCYQNPSMWKDFNRGKATAGSSSYAYFPGLGTWAPGSAMVAYDRKPHNGDGRNIVFADAHVEWRREKNFRAELARQRRAFWKWHAAGARPGEFAKHLEKETADGGGQ